MSGVLINLYVCVCLFGYVRISVLFVPTMALVEVFFAVGMFTYCVGLVGPGGYQ